MNNLAFKPNNESRNIAAENKKYKNSGEVKQNKYTQMIKYMNKHENWII